MSPSNAMLALAGLAVIVPGAATVATCLSRGQTLSSMRANTIRHVGAFNSAAAECSSNASRATGLLSARAKLLSIKELK